MLGNFYLIFVLLSVGDKVLIRPFKITELPYVGLVKKFTPGKRKRDDPTVTLHWFYRRGEIEIRNKSFIGEKELFYSSQEDVQSVKTIMTKCSVHTFKDYCNIDVANPLDLFIPSTYIVAGVVR
ncbi:hypothetical protein TSUD_212960 [Trifolium subterraneum]|uniref:BAH domain-containing protein n=1 Tax=Trifolium subterraneum TaxID=3900 RepID=A0A2Z6N3P6_TRISU|nr:hypothetical protein TSUD_212960 [Trifolium subterraneum]